MSDVPKTSIPGPCAAKVLKDKWTELIHLTLALLNDLSIWTGIQYLSENLSENTNFQM